MRLFIVPRRPCTAGEHRFSAGRRTTGTGRGFAPTLFECVRCTCSDEPEVLVSRRCGAIHFRPSSVLVDSTTGHFFVNDGLLIGD